MIRSLVMADELSELLDTAIYREIASQAQYIAGQSQTEDPGARVLMRELAEEEQQHSQLLKKLKDTGTAGRDWHWEKVPDLMISDYLTGGDMLEGAGLQDTLIFAIKREHQSIEFYSRMMGVLKSRNAKRLCQRLAREELKHKLRLEILYDDLFYGGA
ncbi:ferritin family protein [Chloroflexota bacterium]